MTNLDVIQLTLLSTEDTATTLNECLKEVTKKNKVTILKELNRPFSELEKEHITPKLYHILGKNDYSLNFHFKKDLDDKDIVNNPLINEEATMNWLVRKEKELEKAMLLVNAICYETLKIENFEKIEEELFNKLVALEFIDKTDKKTFYSLFKGKVIYKQPKIKWLKGISYYNMFFHFLEYYKLIDIQKDKINVKVLKGQFFVNAEDKNSITTFERLSKRKSEFVRKRNFYFNNTIFKETEEFKDFKDLETILQKIAK